MGALNFKAQLALTESSGLDILIRMYILMTMSQLSTETLI